jgi:dolichol-phosphate mannosyltransferase
MYDEESNAARTLADVAAALEGRGWSYELLPVSDGSEDGTADLLKNLASADPHIRPVSYQVNRGRGYAMRRGFERAQGDFIATLDADLSYSPDHVTRLVQALLDDPDAEMVLGSPYMPGGSAVGVPFFRLAASRLGNLILRESLEQRIYTSTGILRAYRARVLAALDLESDGKEIHLEILSKAQSLGFRVVEIPATLTARTRGASHFHMKDTVTSHLLFSLLERPARVFRVLGVLLVVASLMIGGYLFSTYLHHGLNPERPLMTLMGLLFLGGLIGLSFALLASQLLQIRRDLVRVQREVLSLREARRSDDRAYEDRTTDRVRP